MDILPRLKLLNVLMAVTLPAITLVRIFPAKGIISMSPFRV
jgi:hypothetical protein